MNITKRFAGIDFGFTNPTAIITIEKDFDNNYWVTSEWYKRNKTDEQIADVVSALHFDEVYPDPESPSAIAELEKRGVYCREVVKNKDSIKNGINAIRALFLQNKLYIHSSCQNLINELETYSYPESKEGRNDEENPVKENDHALDALRYAIFMDEPVNRAQILRQNDRIHLVRQNRNKGFE
jgi:phage terminase large subunit